MSIGKEVYVRDDLGPTARLFFGCMDITLTIEEMIYLAKCLNDAADRAKMRQIYRVENSEVEKGV